MTSEQSGQLAGDQVEPTAFLGGKLGLVQPVAGYRAGFDAILLAACVPITAGTGGRVLDAGAGVGAVGLALAVRIDDACVTLVEREPELAQMARRNITHNGLQERCRVVEADVTSAGRELEAVGLVADSQDFVVANPPYFVEGACRPSHNALKARAHQMPESEIERWLRFATRMLTAHGRLFMIHRTEALPGLTSAMDGRFGDVAVVPIHSRAGEAAKRLFIGARKGSRAPLRIMPGLVVHEGPENAFRPEVKAVCRDGVGLDLF